MFAVSPAAVQRSTYSWLLIAVCCWPFAGCSCSSVQEIKSTPEVDRLLNLQSAYDLAYNATNRPLKDFEELRPHLRDVQDPNKDLVSPNDGLPYVIVYGVERRNFNNGVPIFAYEQQGKAGIRRVVTAMGIESMDEATFRSRVPNAPAQPTTTTGSK
jgi:hypothetical protein